MTLNPIGDEITRTIKEMAGWQDKREKAHFSFLRNILTLAIGFLGLLVGLKSDTAEDNVTKILFFCTIICIGLGILFCVACLFYEVVFLKQNEDALQMRLKQLGQSEMPKNISNQPIPIAFSIYETLTYICLGLSIVALIAYVYFLEFGPLF